MIFGSASGFIGLPAAQACVRAGHQVFGQTRSQGKAKQLIAEESGSATFHSSESNFLTIIPTTRNPVTPIIGEIGNLAAWVDIVKDLDAVIDCVGGTADIKTLS